MKVGEGLGHVYPKPRNVLWRQQANGGEYHCRAICSYFGGMQGRNPKERTDHRDDDEENNQVEKEEHRVREPIACAFDKTQKTALTVVGGR